MSFSVNTNLSALNAYNALRQINTETEKSQLRLATRKQINSVADDTSGYRVGKELESRVSVMKAAQKNVGSAKDLLSTAEAALSKINDLLIQIKGKVSDANDPSKNKTSIANDILSLGEEISSIFSNTTLNGTQLLSGSGYSSGFSFQTGETETTDVGFGTMNTLDLSSITDSGITASTVATLDVDTQISNVQNALGSIGNFVQRLDIKDDFLTSAVTNAKSTISRLFDADMAMEQLNATKGSISAQIATSMLAQLNSAPQQVLGLFR